MALLHRLLRPLSGTASFQRVHRAPFSSASDYMAPSSDEAGAAYKSPFGFPISFEWAEVLQAQSRAKLQAGTQKAVLKARVADMNLTPAQRERLVALVGQRYNPARDELSLIATRHPGLLQNQRYTVELLRRVLEEARKV
eukprot:GILK01007448.1.p1 GENE.GILK01007448.1~~GILK01007448.1.p1  ORF type:complete len:156 (+),score=13.64 GILK01007448.1:50-469(+)